MGFSKLAPLLAGSENPLPDSPPSFPELPQLALQICLGKVWKKWGLAPDEVSGLGLGQLAATWAAGGIDELDAMVLAYEHLLTRQKLATCTESGERDSVLDAFEELADTLNYYPPNLPFLCGLSAEWVPIHQGLAGSFWRRHCQTDPADFAEASHSEKILSGLTSEQLLLIGNGQCQLAQGGKNRATGTNSPNQRSDRQTSDGSLLSCLARLYVLGQKPRFADVGMLAGSRTELPEYPFQRKRYWITELPVNGAANGVQPGRGRDSAAEAIQDNRS